VRVLFVAGDEHGSGVGGFGQRAHRLIGEDVLQAVVGEVIGEGDVAVFEALTGLFKHVRPWIVRSVSREGVNRSLSGRRVSSMDDKPHVIGRVACCRRAST